MVTIAALSTSDNPYDPFDQYEDWASYDEAQGYYSSSYLSRVVLDSNELSFEAQNFAIETAIDEIVAENLIGQATSNSVNYIKVIKNKIEKN